MENGGSFVLSSSRLPSPVYLWAIDGSVSVTAVDGSNAPARIEIVVRLAQINILHGHAAIASQEITATVLN